MPAPLCLLIAGIFCLYFILFFFGLDELRQGIQPPCPYQVHGKGYFLLPQVDTWMQNLCSMVIPSQN